MTRALTFLVPLFVLSACSKKEEPATKPAASAPASATAPATTTANATAPTKPADPNRFAIQVTGQGFEPDDVSVPAGKPVTIVFERKTDKTCAKKVVLTMDDGQKIEKELPLNTPVEIATTFPKAGKLGYACDMDMLKGTITVQ
jgi:plastocyanin domain-containing protein